MGSESFFTVQRGSGNMFTADFDIAPPSPESCGGSQMGVAEQGAAGEHKTTRHMDSWRRRLLRSNSLKHRTLPWRNTLHSKV